MYKTDNLPITKDVKFQTQLNLEDLISTIDCLQMHLTLVDTTADNAAYIKDDVAIIRDLTKATQKILNV